MTSHSSQGQTADGVLINDHTELGAKDLLNNRMAYVAVSHGAHDVQLLRVIEQDWKRRWHRPDWKHRHLPFLHLTECYIVARLALKELDDYKTQHLLYISVHYSLQ